ncbi:hypothetical protein DFH09DRAFT_1067523 [Mycena vulgaris]|nr:hypothetical protein DFH09DRAFT_1067523 [Mycena vulgaris]
MADQTPNGNAPVVPVVPVVPIVPAAPPTMEQKMGWVHNQLDILRARLNRLPDETTLANSVVAALTAQFQQQGQVQQPPAAPPVQTQLQPNGAPVLVIPQSQAFTPPIAPLNFVAAASPSLRNLFPDIEPACITSVITHELRAADLYKLDPRLKDSDPTTASARRARSS